MWFPKPPAIPSVLSASCLWVSVNLHLSLWVSVNLHLSVCIDVNLQLYLCIGVNLQLSVWVSVNLLPFISCFDFHVLSQQQTL